MKRISLVLAFLIFCLSCVYADNSGEFTFVWDTLESLHFCQLALDCRIKEKIPPQKMISDTTAALGNLNKAKKIIQKYTDNRDTDINTIVKNMINGIDILINSNEGLLAKIKNIASIFPDGFENVESETAKFRAKSNKGWEEISSSLSKLSAVIIESVRISKEEKEKLVGRLNELFNGNLKEFDGYKEQDKEGKPDDQTVLTLIVGRIRDALTEENY